MSDLQTLLNPEDSRRKAETAMADVQQYHFVEQHTTEDPPPASPASAGSGQAPLDITLSDLTHRDHPPHANCPDTLNCLPDTEGRPQHTLPVILRCAILGSPRKRLTIREIYASMETKYPYYKTAGQTWKQSVRHHLSLNRLFERQPRPVTDPGFGSYWTVNLDAPPGTKRPRKRGRQNKDAAAGVTQPEEVTAPAEPKGKRGRPRKETEPTPGMSMMSTSQDIRMPAPEDYDIPPFNPSEEEDYDEPVPDDHNHNHPSSSNQMMSQSASHSPIPVPSAEAFGRPGPASLPPPRYGQIQKEEDPYTIIERLKVETSSLRRQSSDAVQLSMRLTEQLTSTQSESNLMRGTIKDLQDKILEEQRLRQDAERMANEEMMNRKSAEHMLGEETRMRTAAQDALRNLQQHGIMTSNMG